MSYGLGVDLGTTFTAAAVVRGGQIAMETLSGRSTVTPSVVLARPDGTVLTGEAAERRAVVEAPCVAREVKRRLGDPMPLILGGAAQPATTLIAHQLRAVLRAVAERRGERPARIVLTHPANWGTYKKELFAQMWAVAGATEVMPVTEPEAAAAYYAHSERLPEGAVVAVYDLGGGTFDAAVLRKTRRGFDLLGRPEGIEGLGGSDFDAAVHAHVDRALDGELSRLDPEDPESTAASVRLRAACARAKEALSSDTEVSIPVVLPGVDTEVRLTRTEFESMIEPAVRSTIASLRRALASAGTPDERLDRVLLVGGSSRIPLVARLVSAELGRPVAVDAHPKHAIALGAALLAEQAVAPAAAAALTSVMRAPSGPSRPRTQGPVRPHGVGAPAVGFVPGPGMVPAAGFVRTAGMVPPAGAPAPALERAPRERKASWLHGPRRVLLAGATALAFVAVIGGGAYATTSAIAAPAHTAGTVARPSSPPVSVAARATTARRVVTTPTATTSGRHRTGVPGKGGSSGGGGDTGSGG